MAKRCFPLSTTRAETIARVSGILIRNLVPLPSTDDSSIVPPIFSMLVRTTSIPTPRPDTDVTLAAVENPGLKMCCMTCLSFIVAISASVARPFCRIFCFNFSIGRPLPSSEISMMM